MSPEAKRPTGRTPKLTTETEQSILDAVHAGATLKDAAEHAGISERTLLRWQAQGEGENAREPYRRFCQALLRARAGAGVNALATLRLAMANGDWRAAAFYLERTDPQQWGKRTAVDVSKREDNRFERMAVEELDRYPHGVDEALRVRELGRA